MSITDELRHNIEGAEQLYGCECKHLLAIADRIDAEHEAMLADVRKTVYQGLIELPKDADGEYIHIGDVMEPKGSGLLFGEVSFEVRAMRYDEGGWEVHDRLGDRYAPPLLRHYHAPTVEDVLTEFSKRVLNSGHQWGLDGTEVIAEYAAKLRLAEGEDA